VHLERADLVLVEPEDDEVFDGPLEGPRRAVDLLLRAQLVESGLVVAARDVA